MEPKAASVSARYAVNPTESAISAEKVSSNFLALAAVLGVFLCTAIALPAQTVTAVHTFTSSPDGQNPYGGLIEAGGALYGVTGEGGTGTCPSPGTTGCGTVYTISGKGYNVLYSFKGAPDGAGPGYESLVTDGKGNFYGTTVAGGTGSCKSKGVVVGCGTVFKITSAGVETVLWSFGGAPNDGEAPNGTLALDSSGNLYGTTLAGGSGTCSDSIGAGCGTVFELTSTGAETVLYGFKDAADGATPWAGVVRDGSGNLYGTTVMGGPHSGGTLFKVTSSGTKTILYGFTFGLSSPNGFYPYGGVIRDSANNLYGTNAGGGDKCSCGTVYEFTGGAPTVLYAFKGGATDGSGPYAPLLRDSAGDLFGTTVTGGPSSGGTVFEIPASGTEKLVGTLNGTTQGYEPFGAVWTSGPNADVYGTAGLGGNAKCGGGNGCGTLFRVVP